MPVDFTSSATFEELLMDLAVRSGLVDYADDGEGAAALPTDAELLRKLKLYVNKGYRRFQREDPNWSFMRDTVRITFAPAGDGPSNVDDDPARYYLPEHIHTPPNGSWRYLTDDAVSGPIEVWHYEDVRTRRAADVSGDPCICGHAPVRLAAEDETPDLERRRWEVIFDPAPDRILTVEADFRVINHTLEVIIDDDEEELLTMRHLCGGDHNDAISAAAWLEWVQDDAERRGDQLTTAQEGYGTLLEQSKAIDKKARRRRLGTLRDTTQEPRPPRQLGEIQYFPNP